MFVFKKTCDDVERAKNIIKIDNKKYVNLTIEECIKKQVISVLKNYFDLHEEKCKCKINEENSEYKFLFEIDIERVRDFIYF